MKSKVLYSMLAISAVFFITVYYVSLERKPVFKLSKSKDVEPSQASIFVYEDTISVTEKKQIFFNTLRPIIENQNQRIRDTRQHVLFARQFDTDHKWVENIAKTYKLDWDYTAPDWDRLLFHVDTIPIELVLTQAANESAWGQSRFAQLGNNLFGQWCFKKGCGIIPGQRDTGSSHEVKKFHSINESVTSYMHNINTSKAYKGLRDVRKKLRLESKPLDAIILATGLEKYSSRGMTYVKEIQSMIKTNYTLMHGISRSK